MSEIDPAALLVLARGLRMRTTTGSAELDATALLTDLQDQGYAVVRLPRPTDVVAFPDGVRRADFGPMVVTVFPDGRFQVQGAPAPTAGEHPESAALAMLAAVRWAMSLGPPGLRAGPESGSG